jgi:NRPS condensation-like uncharacterized protein
VNRRLPHGTDRDQLPRSPFGLIDELSCYYDTPAEPNNEHFEVLVPGSIDYQALRQAVAGALAAAPRARGRMAAGHAFRRHYTWEFPPVPDVDPLSYATWSDDDELLAVRVRFLASAPPLHTSPPVRLLLASGPDASCVILNAHHAAMDGVSCVELLRDIAVRYQDIIGNPATGESAARYSATGDSARARPAANVPPPVPRAQDPVSTMHRHLVARIAPERDRRDRRGRRDGCGLRLLLVPSMPRPSGATVNDMLVAALIATISRWNAVHHRTPTSIRITVPMSVREPGLRGVAGNHTRIETVIADARTAAGELPVLLAAVARQTSDLRQEHPRQASAGALGLAPGWCPVAAKRLAIRFALRTLGRVLCDTSILTNLGNVTDPPWSGPRGPVRMAVTGPAHMPRGLSVGAMTADGQLQLAFRYRYALFDDSAAARFVAVYAATLDELTASTGPHERVGADSQGRRYQ